MLSPALDKPKQLTLKHRDFCPLYGNRFYGNINLMHQVIVFKQLYIYIYINDIYSKLNKIKIDKNFTLASAG